LREEIQRRHTNAVECDPGAGALDQALILVFSKADFDRIDSPPGGVFAAFTAAILVLCNAETQAADIDGRDYARP